MSTSESAIHLAMAQLCLALMTESTVRIPGSGIFSAPDDQPVTQVKIEDLLDKAVSLNLIKNASSMFVATVPCFTAIKAELTEQGTHLANACVQFVGKVNTKSSAPTFEDFSRKTPSLLMKQMFDVLIAHGWTVPTFYNEVTRVQNERSMEKSAASIERNNIHRSFQSDNITWGKVVEILQYVGIKVTPYLDVTTTREQPAMPAASPKTTQVPNDLYLLMMRTSRTAMDILELFKKQGLGLKPVRISVVNLMNDLQHPTPDLIFSTLEFLDQAGYLKKVNSYFPDKKSNWGCFDLIPNDMTFKIIKDFDFNK